MELDDNLIDLPIVKRGRGRPRKEVKSFDEQLDDAIFKAYNITYDNDGNIVFVRNSNILTLEETAILLWATDNYPASGPMTRMAVCNIENRALGKLRSKLKQQGIKSFDQVFGSKRSAATRVYGASQTPE